MRSAAFLLLVLATTVSQSDEPIGNPTASSDTSRVSEPNLGGLWTLSVEDLHHQVVSTMTIRFSTKSALSCMSGAWKRVVVIHHTSSDAKFFPVADPLSYEIDAGRIILGRNEVCDAYLHLVGELRNDTASGEYSLFGISGGKKLGYFTLTKDQSNGP